MDSPFDVLGIDPGADEAEVVRAYRRRVKEAHPDHGGSADEFKAVRAAYEEIVSGEAPESGTDAVEGDGDDEGGDTQYPAAESRVEYLNFEVLDDHGWTLDDADLFEKAAAADLDPIDHGQFHVGPDESVLEAAERRGFAWPYACRGGACANCAVAVVQGELSMPVDHILPREMLDRGIRLSCNGIPISDEMKVVYNLKHLPELDDLRLPPRPFEQAYPTD